MREVTTEEALRICQELAKVRPPLHNPVTPEEVRRILDTKRGTK